LAWVKIIVAIDEPINKYSCLIMTEQLAQTNKSCFFKRASFIFLPKTGFNVAMVRTQPTAKKTKQILIFSERTAAQFLWLNRKQWKWNKEDKFVYICLYFGWYFACNYWCNNSRWIL